MTMIDEAVDAAVDGCEYMLQHLAKPNTTVTFMSGLASFIVVILKHDPNMTVATLRKLVIDYAKTRSGPS